MRSKSIVLSAGLLIGLLSVYGFHDFMLVDVCLDSGGAIDKETGACLSRDTYEEYYFVFTWQAIVLYTFVGALVTAIASYVFHKLYSSIWGGHEKT